MRQNLWSLYSSVFTWNLNRILVDLSFNLLNDFGSLSFFNLIEKQTHVHKLQVKWPKLL